MSNERWATFDCYGTLIDWETGIGDALGALWPEAGRQDLLSLYHRVEPSIQAAGSIPYREVMRRAVRTMAGEEELPLRPNEDGVLADSLPGWPVFPEVPRALGELRARGWRLAILSNTDPDLLDSSIHAIGVVPEMTVTAADAGSYKPRHGHWERFRERSGVDGRRHVHVAASLFHDIAPAAGLGITAVWINRRGESSPLPRAAELPDLSTLPVVLEALVPKS